MTPKNKFLKRLKKLGLSCLAPYKGTNYKVSLKCYCGKMFDTLPKFIISGNTRSCGCLTKRVGDKNPTYKGFGELTGTQFGQIRGSAKYRDIDFNLTTNYLWDLFLRQNRKCAFSGVTLSFSRNYKDCKTTASLDRIDSSKGYVPGNVQWVHKKVNNMKWDKTDKEFIYWCNLISENSGGDEKNKA